MIRALCLLVLVTATGCATLTPEQRVARDDRILHNRLERIRTETTICIVNNTAAMGNLYGGEVGRYRHKYDIMGGHIQCEFFKPAGRTSVELYVETIGGSAWGPTRAWATIPVKPGLCWIWDVRNNMSNDAWIQCRN